jgi:two-component system sensor histidine kinase UhpB
VNKYRYKHFGILARVILIAILPVALLASSVVLYNYYSRLAEASEELDEHAKVVATALAQSSEYSVISGNFSDIERLTKGLVKADSSIYQISIFDVNKREPLRVTSTLPRDAENRYFDVEIRRQLLPIDPFGDSDAPHVSSLKDAQNPVASAPLDGEVIGMVRVTMSPTDLLRKQKNRAYIQSILVLLIFAASVLIALWLAGSLTRPMAIAIAALRAIRGGDFSKRINVTTGGEIAELQSAINEMSVSLGNTNQRMESEIKARTKELEASRNEAVRSSAEKRKLIHKVNTIAEFERKNIAVEIHDELNATLVGAKFDSQRILSIVGQLDPRPELEEVKERAQSIVKLTKDLYAAGRAIVTRLRPEILDTLGLSKAIEEIVNHYDRGSNTCTFSFESVGDFTELDGGLTMAVYRLAQEALSNVVKHAQATQTSVSLILSEDQETLKLTIIDNGIGFDPANVQSGLGLVGMRERVYGYNGTIDIRPGGTGGTEIEAVFPTTSV